MGRARDVSRALAERADEVCRYYLSNGRRVGSFWIVGDVHNTPGRSLHVRLRGDRSRIGRWADESTAEYGDLLDLIRLSADCATISDAIVETERFLGHSPNSSRPSSSSAYGPIGDHLLKRTKAARLLALAEPLTGTPAGQYLLARGLKPPWPSVLGYLSAAMYRDGVLLRRGPAMLAPITDAQRRLIGVHRTWIALRGGRGVAIRRRILGYARGGGVWLGGEGPAVLAGEGIETVLSLRHALPLVRLYAALSAGKLGSWPIPPETQALLVAVDRDQAGYLAAERLAAQAQSRHLPFLPLLPRLGDFNDDLVAHGPDAVRAHVLDQLREGSPALLHRVCGPGDEAVYGS